MCKVASIHFSFSHRSPDLRSLVYALSMLVASCAEPPRRLPRWGYSPRHCSHISHLLGEASPACSRDRTSTCPSTLSPPPSWFLRTMMAGMCACVSLWLSCLRWVLSLGYGGVHGICRTPRLCSPECSAVHTGAQEGLCRA